MMEKRDLEKVIDNVYPRNISWNKPIKFFAP